MANGSPASLIGFVRRLASSCDDGDVELLRRFVQQRDESAFAALVHRHGPVVLSACRRWLRSASDIEDAFQAVFLVLARRAESIAQPEQIGPWLYGVAVRVARKAGERGNRTVHLENPELMPARDGGGRSEWESILDEELTRLPEKYRTPLVLCCLQGLSREEAAARLKQSPGAIKGLLERGRERLRERLEKRGLSASVLPPTFDGPAVPPALLDATVALTGRASAGLGVDTSVASLAEGVISTMQLSKWKVWLSLGLILATFAGAGWAMTERPVPKPVVARQKDVEPEPQKKIVERDLKTSITASVWSGKQLVLGDGVGQIHLWNPDADKVERFQQDKTKSGINVLALSRDGKTLASADDTTSVTLWDVGTKKKLATIARDSAATGLAFHPDGKSLAGVSHSSDVSVWDARTGKTLRTFRAAGELKEGLNSLVYSPNGKQLFVSGRAVLNFGTNWATFYFLDAAKDTRTGAAGGEELDVNHYLRTSSFRAAVACSPDSKLFASATSDDKVFLHPGDFFTTRHKGITAVAFLSDNKTLVSAGQEGSIRFWTLKVEKGVVTQTTESALVEKQGEGLTLALSPDGKRLAWANKAGKVTVADVARLQKVHAVKAKRKE